MKRQDTIEESTRHAILDVKETINGIDYSFLAREYEDMEKSLDLLNRQVRKLNEMIWSMRIKVALKMDGTK